MKRLLSTTAALSMAFAPIQPWPLMAQNMDLVLQEDGSILDDTGAVVCAPTAEQACDPEAVMQGLMVIRDAAQAEADAAAAAAIAAAEADAAAAAAIAAAEAAAAAAAQAEAEAAAQAAAEASQAEADAAAQAAAEASQAEADAAAQAAAEASQAEADAAAQAAAEASQAEAAAAALADAEAAQAEANAAAQAAAEAAQAEADAAAQAGAEAAQAEADAAAQAAAEALQAEADAAAETAAEATTAAEGKTPTEPVAEVVPLEPISEEAEAALAAAAAAEEEARAAAEIAATAPVEAPVDVPVVSEAQVGILSDLLANPDVAGAAGLGAAAALVGAGNAPADAAPTGADAPAEVTTTTVTAADTRSSFEEFAAAPTAVSAGKKSGLSDLEKVGLVALGALVVGAVLNNGREVVANTGDRVVVQDDRGGYQIYKDDDTLLRRPGTEVRTETYRDGSTRTIVGRENGTEVVTIRDATGRVIRRATYDSRGNELILIDDMAPEERIDVSTLPRPRADRVTISTRDENAAMKAALARTEAEQIGRAFSLRQVREIKEVRRLAATIDVENITFESGSAVIRTTQARNLADLGRIMGDILEGAPDEVFLIEGHTDAVGSAVSNLTLSDRRAESVALALTEYFGIPPENLVVQGYGEGDLRIATQSDERLNRRVAVRVVTPLLRSAQR